MTNRISLSIAATVIIINLLLAHFLAPTGMVLTPFVLTIVTAIVVFGTQDLRPLVMTLVVVGLVILHDIGIKLYSGGSHDQVGSGWVQLLLIIGLVPTYLLTLVGIFRSRSCSWTEKVLSLLIFPLIMAMHVYLSHDLGRGRYYSYDWIG